MGEFSEFTYSASDGLRLSARIYGDGSPGTLPVVCLAGLTRNARDFHELALHLSQDAPSPRTVIAFDYRGRGRSAWDPEWRNYDVGVEAGDVVAGLAALGVERAAFIGTSRGGLIIFVLSAMRPSLLGAVVLNDIGPMIEPAGLAQIRGYLRRAPKPADLAEAIAVQRTATGASFPALTDEDWERATRAYYREDAGRLVPDFDPALVKAMASLDLDKPLPLLWPQFNALSGIPLMAIRGEHSGLLSAKTFEQMQALRPDMAAETVAGQGHAPFLETAGLPGKIAAFLSRADARMH